jgi:hypothetical protein
MVAPVLQLLRDQLHFVGVERFDRVRVDVRKGVRGRGDGIVPGNAEQDRFVERCAGSPVHLVDGGGGQPFAVQLPVEVREVVVPKFGESPLPEVRAEVVPDVDLVALDAAVSSPDGGDVGDPFVEPVDELRRSRGEDTLSSVYRRLDFRDLRS